MNRKTLTALRTQLGLSPAQWRSVREAAKDCHLPPRDYCRLMVLAAAGCGGIVEHLDRAIQGSWKAEGLP